MTTTIPSTLTCPETGQRHRWRRQSRRRAAACHDCNALRCAGYIAAGRGIYVNRCPYPAVAYPADVPSCPDHAGNPGGTRC